MFCGGLACEAIEMVQIESEAIDEIAYDEERSIMFVRFAHGGSYRYFDVPKRVYEDFLAAESHGRFFHDHIRDRYSYRQDRQA
jgi:hypothetical protein